MLDAGMLKRSAEPIVEDVKIRRVDAMNELEAEKGDVGPTHETQLLCVAEVGGLPSSSEADTTCEVCDGDGGTTSAGSSVPGNLQGKDAAHHVPEQQVVDKQDDRGEEPDSTEKAASNRKVKKSVRFAEPGPIISTPDGHPEEHRSCTMMVAKAPSPYAPYTPIKPVEALTRHSLTAMERELGDEFREENALSLVRLKRRVGSLYWCVQQHTAPTWLPVMPASLRGSRKLGA